MTSTLTCNRLLPVAALVFAATTPTHAGEGAGAYRWQEVSGSAIHYFDDVEGRKVITHSATPRENGVTLRTTETIDIFGDLNGRVLYHPTTQIDQVAGTLVNTGSQVFSGTVLGAGPVLLHDDEFRFDVNIFTGETVGQVFLVNRIAGPIVRCELEIVGTGFSPEGNGLADYTGRCRMLGKPGRDPR